MTPTGNKAARGSLRVVSTPANPHGFVGSDPCVIVGGCKCSALGRDGCRVPGDSVVCCGGGRSEEESCEGESGEDDAEHGFGFLRCRRDGEDLGI